MKATTTPRTCHTCLYMATHEKCDGCLNTKEDWAEYRATGNMPPNRYANYEEGNWLDRMIEAERSGQRNIVIGGQGEAECNTRWTPQKTSTHLHYVSGECGYLTGNLHRVGDEIHLRISTQEGTFLLVWDVATEQLQRIENVNDSNGWHWTDSNPFRDKAA